IHAPRLAQPTSGSSRWWRREVTRTVTLRASAVVVALLASGCGGGTHGRAGAHKTIVRRCAAGARQPLGSSRLAWAAVVIRPTTAYRSPGGSAIQRFGLRNVNGAATVFAVAGMELDVRCRVAWLHVALPIHPNGAS